MSRWKVMSIVLMIGLGIGGIVPATTSWWYAKNRIGSTDINAETAIAKEAPAKVIYHFKMEQGVLSVIEGNLGSSGRVIVTGLNVQTWPKEMVDMAPKVEFYSLDEVQSFIDTANEPLWQE
ncbi:hypothetical protein [Desulfosporosinus sp. Sb-LF]|uniref:hypothetical protein n=1 Tax=Desulfosporosinus sp. Sb-LF TaxID=2560027 RepID=UPI00107FA5EF|nr:hypothetical protein [Desulfosporosinus sp. Sb-LF]TGE34150.1 hypothetical protein E4K68_00085 [Desulfosporosinus sp. Sb-LF]